MTYSELYKDSVEKLKKVGIEDAESDIRILFQEVFDVDRGFLFVHGEDTVDEIKAEKLYDMLTVREQRIPLQHITGKQNFMGLDFLVSKDVLIPRFDTECLVEEAMLVCNDGDKVLDVCTGSGCILISIMKYKNGIRGIGCDISEAALQIAKKNAAELCKPQDALYSQNDLSYHTDNERELINPLFVQSDMFSNIMEKDFDIIVSNPPYIRSDVIETLMPEVKNHDPMLALDGGEDGLIFYRRLTDEAKSYLKKGGYLLVEIGYDQGDDVKTLYENSGYKDVRVIKDLCGNNRVVSGKYDGL